MLIPIGDDSPRRHAPVTYALVAVNVLLFLAVAPSAARHAWWIQTFGLAPAALEP